MTRSLIRLVLVSFVALLPCHAISMDHGKDESQDHLSHGGQHDSSHHDAIEAESGMFILGDRTINGVRGMAHLKDVREVMAKIGLSATHHFMIAFADVETGKQIKTGQVALKIKDPAGKTSEPIKLIGMEGHFGADIVLDKQGVYHLRIGTKLPDGEKREYHFHHKVK